MSNKFYEPGADRARRVGELFGAISKRYDLLNDIQTFGMHRKWKQRVVGLATVGPNDRALDVCCGTGDISFALALQGAEVVGLDFSEAMLAVAEERKQRELRSHRSSARSQVDAEVQKGLSILNPQFCCGDALQLSFPSETFDIVTIGYGLRNLASWENGLREMVRVLRPNGRVVALEFGKPDNALWRHLYFTYLKFAVPLIGLLFARNPRAYAYILESLKHYPGQRALAQKMTDLGLVEVRIENLLAGVMSINSARKPISAT